MRHSERVIKDILAMGVGRTSHKDEGAVISDVIKKAEKYKWHILKDNPNDLPKVHQVLVAYDLFGRVGYEVVYYGKTIFPKRRKKVFYRYDSEYGDVPIDSVVAWAYIPPLESEANDD